MLQNGLAFSLVQSPSSPTLAKKKNLKGNKSGDLSMLIKKSNIEFIADKKLKPLIQRNIEDYEENEKTFRDIPLVVHHLLVFIFEQINNQVNYLNNTLLSDLNISFESPKDVIVKYSKVPIIQLKNKSIPDLIEMGFTDKDANTLISKRNEQINFFGLLNYNSNISNEQFVKLIKLTSKYLNGELPNLNKEVDVNFAFILLKYFFLNLPKPLLNEKILNVFEMGLTMKNKVGVTRVKNYLSEEIENVLFKLNHESSCSFILFKEIILFIRTIIDLQQLENEEKQSIYLCYFNAMFQNDSFKKEYLPLIDMLFEGLKYTRKIYEIFPFEKEIIIKKFEFVFCPLFCVSLYEEVEINDTIPGSLFFTSHRIIFKPDSQPNQREYEVLKYLGLVSICNILKIVVNSFDNFHYLRIICKDIKVLTFRIVGQIQPYEDIIENIKQHYRYSTQIEYIPPVCSHIDSLTKEVQSCIQNISIIEGSIINCEEIFIAEEVKLKPLICYQTILGSQLIRFPLLKNNFPNVVLNSNTIKFKENYQGLISKYDLIGEEDFDKLFNKIQEIIPIVNTQSNQNVSHFFEASNRISDEIKIIIDYSNKLSKQLTSKKIHLVLISNKNNEKGLCILSSLIQIIIDPFYRTINGFLDIIQKEFISFEFFGNNEVGNSTYFVLFLLCVNLLYRQNNCEFQFDEKLIQFSYNSLFSNGFFDLTQIRSSYDKSFISLVQSNTNEFINPLFQNQKVYLQTELIEGDCCTLIFKWLNYTKKCTKIFMSETLSTKNIGLGIYSFPPIDIPIYSFSTLKILDLSNNRLKEFPVELLQLPQLIEISLNNNDILFVTNQITKLINLTSLSLGNNCLLSIPDLSTLSLKKLDLSSNDFPRNYQFEFCNSLEYFNGSEFISYPTILSALPNITSLDFSHMRFDVLEIINNPPRSLQELKISHCHLPIIPEEITRLALSNLDVSNNSINKMNYSFFSMSSLKLLNLSGNYINGKNALFKTMSNLEVIAEDVKLPKRRPSVSFVPSIKLTKTTLNEQILLYGLEKIIITGDDLRKEIFNILQKRINEEGTIFVSNEHSITFELIDKKKKEKKNLIMIEASIDQLEKEMWKLRRSIFIVCKTHKESNEDEIIIEMVNLMQIHGYIHVVCNEEIINNFDDKKDFIKIKNYLFVEEKKKKKSIISLWNKLLKQINKLFIIGGDDCLSVINELKTLRIPGFCLTVKELKELMEYLGIKEWMNVLNWLTKNGYIFSNNDFRDKNSIVSFNENDHLLVDLDVFELVSKTIQKNCDKNGFMCVNIFELLGIKNKNIEFLLTLFEKNGLLMKITKEMANKYLCDKQFIEVLSTCSEQSQQLKKYSQSTSGSSALSNGSYNSFPIIVTEKIELKHLVLYTYHEYKDTYEKELWPENHLRNEIEIGRLLQMKIVNYKTMNLIVSMIMLKYNIHTYWKNGAIVIIQKNDNQGKLYVMIETNRRCKSIEFHMRGLISSAEIPFLMVKEINDIENLIKNICKETNAEIDRIDILCNDCLQKGIKTIIPIEEIKNNIDKFLYSFKWKEHNINCLSCLLDYIIKSLPKEFMNTLEQYDFIKEIGSGSNSIISLYKNKRNNELVVAKIGKLDLSGVGLNEKYSAFELFASSLEEYLREIQFISFPSHPTIAKIYGYSINPLFVTMEYFNGGSLYDLLNQKKYNFSIKEKIIMAKEIATAINLLHTYKIPLIHRDIKSPNILIRLTENGLFKNCALSDFGETVPTITTQNSNVECPYWLAPEIINGNKFTQKSDVYSFAIILWEISSNKPPFSEFNFFSEIREKVVSGYRPLLNNNTSLFNLIINQCWNADQSLRPTMKEVIIELEKLKE